MRVACTHHLSDAAVQPGQLDIVLVPGPDPATKFEDKTVTDWLAAHATRAETDILCVCTGIYLCGAAGLLKEGRRACGPRGLQDDLKKLYPGVAWVGDDLRWVRDGNFWSSGEHPFHLSHDSLLRKKQGERRMG
jgi:transcriptional regulator GlxA family with amidase domain